VVEIPRAHAYRTAPDERFDCVHVPLAVASNYYDTTTGWRR
jgi:hypothetical protein